MSQIILGNTLILSKVLSFLPLKDIKTTRLVNRLWLDQSKEHFYSKGSATLPNFYKNANWSPYLDGIKHHKNIKIDIFLELEVSNLLCGLISFTESNGTSIKCFQIKVVEMDFSSNPPKTKIKNLLEVLNNCPQLEELEITMLLTYDSYKQCFPTNLKSLQLLKKLKLKLDFGKHAHKENTEVHEFCKVLLKTAPNLEKISFSSDTPTHQCLIETLSELLEEAKKENVLLFQNLKLLVVKRCLLEYGKLFALCQKLSPTLPGLRVKEL